jgi:hypothetical protein
MMHKLGAFKTCLLITLFPTVSSVVLYLVIAACLGNLEVEGILISVLIPAVVAPLASYVFLSVLFQLDREEKKRRQSELKYRSILKTSRISISR